MCIGAWGDPSWTNIKNLMRQRGNGGGAGASVIYTLTGSATGYTLTNITVFGGWKDAGRDQQAYTVYYSKVAAPATFILLRSVNYNPPNPANAQAATRATLTPASGVLVTNVAAVKIDFITPTSAVSSFPRRYSQPTPLLRESV